MGVLTQTEVVKKTGLSRTSISRLRARGAFPEPRKLPNHRLEWLADDIESWVGDNPKKFIFSRHPDPWKRILARAYLDGASGCLVWEGPVNNRGYGIVQWRCRPDYAHRAAWEIAHGPLGSKERVSHQCGNKICINVEHLFVERQ